MKIEHQKELEQPGEQSPVENEEIFNYLFLDKKI
jgi:hypothetical protein